MERDGRMLRRTKRIGKTLLRPLMSPWLTRRRIVADLRTLGLEPDGIALVHSSLSALGFVVGGAHTVIDALREILGPRGTLLLPTHSWEVMETGCRVFDVRQTPSCVGTITEKFRAMHGSMRSLHPTHSVAAIGPQAAWIVADHDQCTTPCGEGTPYDKALSYDCQILFLGTGLESNTAYHTVEALTNASYLLGEDVDTFTLIDEQGESRLAKVRRHRPRIERRFTQWEDLLVEEGIVKRGLVGRARTLLLRGRPFREFMLQKLAREPRFLIAS